MNYLAFCLLSCSSLLACAQDFQPKAKIDHIAIVVDDLQRSTSFYEQVFGLEPITNQTQNPDIRWYQFADGVELHIIKRSKEGIRVKKDLHLAVAINDLDAFMHMLDQKEIAYESWQGKASQSNARPDGIRQVYLQDPDGYWIEVNDASRF